MKNKLEDLRNHLFAALEGLADESKPMDVERAKAIADVGRVVIEAAKTELAIQQLQGHRPPGQEVTAPPPRARITNGSKSR